MFLVPSQAGNCALLLWVSVKKEGKQKWGKSLIVQTIGENDEQLCVNRTHLLNRSLGRFRELLQQRVLLSSNIGVNNI